MRSLKGDRAKTEERILTIYCSDEHLLNVRNERTGSVPLRNIILEMIRNELSIDHFYVSQK